MVAAFADVWDPGFGSQFFALGFLFVDGPSSRECIQTHRFPFFFSNTTFEPAMKREDGPIALGWDGNLLKCIANIAHIYKETPHVGSWRSFADDRTQSRGAD